jgi:hypothetical protein
MVKTFMKRLVKLLIIFKPKFCSRKNINDNILIATISVTRSCTSLSDSLTSKIIYVSKFGELVGGGGGASIVAVSINH